ncbi:hypothetical protein [Rhizobium leguminosarum]|jgi:hypothetical protein|uniref:hypothetical protein n=1 Tax=Rhizobium leguminosarum TaxID=384 RepID=UPI001C94220D|nr:hypothetical protein [Rhizobium leguminosarum]MBY5808954.1 hypothetical protein [Rhizobium leguminosarum]
MEYHLDRRLRFFDQPKHKSLYSWAINEVDKADQVVGDDQIPWGWSLYFTATDIVLSDRLVVSEANEVEGRLSQTAEVSHRRTITAKLRPGAERDADDWHRQTTYRMFGTDRAISDFRLDILPLKSEGEIEHCRAWGAVSYTFENDFREETTDDCVLFSLMVKPSTFERYAHRIISGTEVEVILCVGAVSGFYSSWSPSISTRDVKVLAPGGEQVVEVPESITLPRLGAVGEATLYLNAGRAKKLPSPSHLAVPEERQAMPAIRPGIPNAQSIDPQMAKLLASLKSSLNWIIGLLAALVIATLLKS